MSDNQNEGHSNGDPPNETYRADIRETFAGLLERLSDPTYWLRNNHTRGTSNLQMMISKLDENGTPFSIHIDVAIGGYHCQFFSFFSKGIHVKSSSPQLAADDRRMRFIKIETERVTKVAEKMLQINVVQINRCVGKSLSYQDAIQSLNRRIASIKEFIFNSTYDIVEQAFVPVDDVMDVMDAIEQNGNQPGGLGLAADNFGQEDQNIPPPDQGANVPPGAGDQNIPPPNQDANVPPGAGDGDQNIPPPDQGVPAANVPANVPAGAGRRDQNSVLASNGDEHSGAGQGDQNSVLASNGDEHSGAGQGDQNSVLGSNGDGHSGDESNNENPL